MRWTECSYSSEHSWALTHEDEDVAKVCDLGSAPKSSSALLQCQEWQAHIAGWHQNSMTKLTQRLINAVMCSPMEWFCMRFHTRNSFFQSSQWCYCRLMYSWWRMSLNSSRVSITYKSANNQPHFEGILQVDNSVTNTKKYANGTRVIIHAVFHINTHGCVVLPCRFWQPLLPLKKKRKLS